MNDILRMAMVDRLEELLHVVRRLPLSKYLVYLLAYLLEEWHSRDVLHYQVNIHSIVVGLVVFNNAGVIECMQCSYLIHDIG